jgi:hypothetical protein
MASTATLGAAMLSTSSLMFSDGEGERQGRLTRGDAAILRFLAAAGIIERDLWLQYAELGGSQTQPNGQPDNELPGRIVRSLFCRSARPRRFVGRG